MALIPNALEEGSLGNLQVTLTHVHQVSMLLQSEDRFMNLAHVRSFFDTLILKVDHFAEYLGPNANIVHMPIFEAAVAKVQQGNERLLNTEEKRALLSFRKDPHRNNEVIEDEIATAASTNEFLDSYNLISETKKEKNRGIHFKLHIIG